jgi:CheY-like chemotaxis protein/HPt (histidine-containing phosphotransfer) domain-containing protein
MSALRILHVDDEPDIRDLVEIALGLDPAFAVRSCASSEEALGVVAEWSPHLILVDVTMPGLDGPAMLARLRASPQTAQIPVVFMTARAQTKELEQFKALGAIGVIPKPFDPMTLAEAVRGHLRAARVKCLSHGFAQRLQLDKDKLTGCRSSLGQERESTAVLENIKSCAHALAGSAGIFGYAELGRNAGELEEAVISKLDGTGEVASIAVALDRLLATMPRH